MKATGTNGQLSKPTKKGSQREAILLLELRHNAGVKLPADYGHSGTIGNASIHSVANHQAQATELTSSLADRDCRIADLSGQIDDQAPRIVQPARRAGSPSDKSTIVVSASYGYQIAAS